MEQLTNADKRDRYLFSCIYLFQTISGIIAAEGYDYSHEMPDEEPMQIIEDIIEIIYQLSERTGLTFDGIQMKHGAIIKNVNIQEN